MDNLSDSRKNNVLPDFQAFLLDKKVAQEKNVIKNPGNHRVVWLG